MHVYIRLLTSILLIFCAIPLNASLLPVAHEGRFKPLTAQAKGKKHVAGLWERQIASRRPLRSDSSINLRLAQAGGEIIALPSKMGKGRWLPLNALLVDVWDEQTSSWQPVNNFTLYPTPLFRALQAEYRSNEVDLQKFEALALDGYSRLAEREYLPELHYPSLLQLKMEHFYFSYPLILLTLMLYAAALLLLFKYPRIGIAVLALAFLSHSCLLGLRIFILQRPPVSNMVETVIYVPWVAMITGTLIAALNRSKIALQVAAGASIILLALLQTLQMDDRLENVQAVLNSQFWLTIHVLLIVASYGVLIFAGILAHIHLLTRKNQTKPLLQSLYLGTALLINGTLLGGVWAAQSWGRFWDWDPKESWAFISSCFYITTIHAYRFRKIGENTLAIGAIIGLMAISFTWYGVNYILGTGLHSYGFGSGGEWVYFTFLTAEVAFILFARLRIEIYYP